MEAYINKLRKEFLPEEFNPAKAPCSEKDGFGKEDEPTDEKEIEQMKALPYRRLVACLLWTSTTVRSDVSFCVKKLSQPLNNPGKKMWTNPGGDFLEVLLWRVHEFKEGLTDQVIIVRRNNRSVPEGERSEPSGRG